jgi:hypothetical protein
MVYSHNIEEFGQQFSIEKKVGSCGKLVCHCIQEYFWAMILVLLAGALFGLHSE